MRSGGEAALDIVARLPDATLLRILR
jgi:hypothetical protein